ncbi:hypothetical protein Mame_01406 [Martelella mediterranea DSM 17316]|uniref:Uncharacterized protein n=1 Tax=Martelella mediterranea DSM 17316 TaxID=1122214 RepID=A0A1U9YZ99_9HYPH|nr:hypothetical protein Mame_01406 [Martelella mediterranea DSM 17316]
MGLHGSLEADGLVLRTDFGEGSPGQTQKSSADRKPAELFVVKEPQAARRKGLTLADGSFRPEATRTPVAPLR